MIQIYTLTVPNLRLLVFIESYFRSNDLDKNIPT